MNISQNKKPIYIIIIFLFFVALALSLIIFSLKKDRGIEVIFLDVGQGDAILIKEGSNQVLVDGGRNGMILLEKLGEYVPFWDRRIETMIVTHPDADHYGGLVSVLDSYKVKNIIKTDAVKDNKEWGNFEKKIIAEKAESVRSIYGMNIVFANGAKLQTIYPFSKVNHVNDSNDSSVVARLDFGENSFLLAGDISEKIEKFLISSGVDIDVDILKLAHHGSKSSSNDVFLDVVTPDDAIISVGAKNSYGHPHKEVLERLKNRLIRVWRTDEDGDIVYTCLKDKKCEVFAD